MSVVTECWLVCDGYLCPATFGEEDNQRTLARQRKLAEQAGWGRGSEGRDYCPSCLSKVHPSVR